MKKLIFALLAVIIAGTAMGAEKKKPGKNYPLRRTNREWLASDEARGIARQVIAYQRVTGGWPKNIDMCRPHTAEELEAVRADHDRRDDSTTDNNATTTQIEFLARMYDVTGDTLCRDAFRRGIEYLLSGQYTDTGGWPQFWPDPQGYQEHITYNDDAMANTLFLLKKISDGEGPYAGDIAGNEMKDRVQTAFDKGIECILATQIRVDGHPTVWCQQHDHITLAPAKARSYELPSYCSQESATLVRLLMQLPDPDERIREAVDGAMKWFDDHKLTGYRLERTGERGAPDENTRLIADPDAGPLWGRFYDLDNCEIYVCDRDGV
ncbi:MAG: pectate lyase, partial [Muribaculaceae bacterium]|nr:pectate lyase [Muribaculaceae bacterium]